MELVRGLVNLRERHRGAIVTIGSFDGIHLGHQALIERTRAHAARLGRPAMMISFEPLPREFLARADPPARLTSLRERCRMLPALGLDRLCLLRFTERLRSLTGEAFVRLLTHDLRCAGIVVGHDFRFGRNGEANVAALERAAATLGFEVEVVPPVLVGGSRVSSSDVRSALAAGDFARARSLLGRPYSMRGRVMSGERLGRTLGFPTANLRLERRRSPLWGIFAVRVSFAAAGHAVEAWPAVASLGTRPTVGGVEPVLEVHLFDFAAELYGYELEVEFVAKLRDEERFESLEALIEQMHRDAQAARRLLAA